MPGHVAGGEYELANGVELEGTLFEEIVADVLVGGEKNPIVSSYDGKPLFVRRAGLKVREMALKRNPKIRERVLDCGGVTEIFVEVEDEGFRRQLGALAPSELLLRFLAACGHILRRGLRWTRAL